MQSLSRYPDILARLPRMFCVLALLAAGCIVDSLRPASAAELLMFERAGCPWCRKWDSEIGAIYPKTPEGRTAPLRRISLDKPVPADVKLTPPVFYTPSFVLMENGREIGRITGYIGDDAFWGLLTKMIEPLRERRAVDQTNR
jgi:hypothetical protein